jgi:hypothetical protein
VIKEVCREVGVRGENWNGSVQIRWETKEAITSRTEVGGKAKKEVKVGNRANGNRS